MEWSEMGEIGRVQREDDKGTEAKKERRGGSSNSVSSETIGNFLKRTVHVSWPPKSASINSTLLWTTRRTTTRALQQ